MDRWSETIPRLVAKKQRIWERNQAIKRAKKTGMLNEEIGNIFNLSREGVRRVLNCLERSKTNPNTPAVYKKLSPVESYFNETGFVVLNEWMLYSMKKFARCIIIVVHKN